MSAINSAWCMVGIQVMLVESESSEATVITGPKLKAGRRRGVNHTY